VKILLVRLRQIGDVVFTTPAFAALRERYPNAELTYVVEPAAAPVVCGNPDLANVIVAPRRAGLRGFVADIAFGRRLARERFDVAIDFHGGPRASLLTWLSSAPVRVGYRVAGRVWMYTHRIERPRALRPRHSVENQWLRALDVPAPTPERYPVAMRLDDAAAAGVRERLAAHGVDRSARLAVVHVSAGNPFRRWPIESFAEVAAALASSAHVVITSGPSEAEAAAGVIERARRRLPAQLRHHIVSCGEFSLSELRALVDAAALYIGPMHIAATSRVPIVSLYGPTLPVRSRPWRGGGAPSVAIEVADLDCRPCDQRVCRYGDFRCLGSITPDQVIDAARRLLDRTDKMRVDVHHEQR
jgi:lipopolysaccharide heptosyltransferase II